MTTPSQPKPPRWFRRLSPEQLEAEHPDAVVLGGHVYAGDRVSLLVEVEGPDEERGDG